ncbi:MAG TPA: type I 3-dehydroquinate dehydratase [Candidatus Hydrogenedentes bacterium]|nr:type I 3-dehydroquinate dehydratase [Candidatus Hydrogenedentota bacterium]HOC72842.1 type I 3-dehydroquinate dehydratase [Candidatus Hydrogenedentota bacterium]
MPTQDDLTLRIGTCVLGPRPRVVVALRAGAVRAEVEQALAAGADIIELRADLFPSPSPETVAEECARFEGIPRLLTVRSAAEGGGWNAGGEERLACILAGLPHAEAVDVELSSADILARVVAAARASGKTVIGSFHDFSDTPGTPALEAVAAAADRAGVDILKIAATCNTAEDFRRLAQFTLSRAPRPVAVMGMGSAGMPSRIFFPSLGSLLTYTFLGEPSAPGQLNCRDTVKYINLFYGSPASPEGGGHGHT